eukprot:TRINITY_DN28121_c0_g1_i1.p1 TRINITY_DN28121_c0_g1~~TRINITY_DN28121_c0_g1_i1.p1  ORF type:complete len:250 (-),score=61.07 TRINITY_DN28121_c0_g1_i1:86-835(-)
MTLPLAVIDTIENILGLGAPCTRELFVNFHFNNVKCLKLLASKGLGAGVVVGSSVVKVPQIIKVIQNRSVAGLSLAMFLLELVGQTVSLAFNFQHGYPFSTWGEYVFITLQNVFLLFLMDLFGGAMKGGLWIGFAIYSSITYALLVGLVPTEMLDALQAGVTLLFIASRLPQIYQNFKSHGVGQLSLITWMLIFVGSLARIYTTLMEVPDKLVMGQFLLASLLNGTIFFQIVYYNYITGDGKKKKKKEA